MPARQAQWAGIVDRYALLAPRSIVDLVGYNSLVYADQLLAGHDSTVGPILNSTIAIRQAGFADCECCIPAGGKDAAGNGCSASAARTGDDGRIDVRKGSILRVDVDGLPPRSGTFKWWLKPRSRDLAATLPRPPKRRA